MAHPRRGRERGLAAAPGGARWDRKVRGPLLSGPAGAAVGGSTGSWAGWSIPSAGSQSGLSIHSDQSWAELSIPSTGSWSGWTIPSAGSHMGQNIPSARSHAGWIIPSPRSGWEVLVRAEGLVSKQAGTRRWVSLPEGQRSRSSPTAFSHTPSKHPLALGTCWLTTPLCLSQLACDCGPGGAWQLSLHDREDCVGEILVEVAWAAQASSTALVARGSQGGEPCCAMAAAAIRTGGELRTWLLPGRLVEVGAGWDR